MSKRLTKAIADIRKEYYKSLSLHKYAQADTIAHARSLGGLEAYEKVLKLLGEEVGMYHE